ncbi:MAPEG family protein [Thalassotalea montiporae]
MSISAELAITGLYTSLLAILFIALSFNVSRLRLKHKVSIGSDGVRALEKAIRIQANFTEYVPLALIMLAVLELAGLAEMWLHIFGLTILLGRVLHAMGLTKTLGVSLARQIGTLATFIVLLVMPVTFLVMTYV